MTPRRFQEIAQCRRVYFGTADGKAVLCDTLRSLGVFAHQNELAKMMQDPAPSLRLLIEGLNLLKDLGVLDESNQSRLIDAMAALPMPEMQETE